MLRLWTFGTAELEAPPHGTVSLQPKRTLLLAYLRLANPRRVERRESLVGLFWPDIPQDRARAALRQALYHLRRRLGDAVVTVGDDAVGLVADSIWCDAAAFQHALEAGRLEEALELYRGEFLSGLTAAPPLETWLESRRRELRRRARDGVLELARRATDAGEALAWATRAHHLDPYGEAAAEALVRAHLAAGEPAAARDVVEDWELRLREDLGTEPHPRVTRLLDAPSAAPTPRWPGGIPSPPGVTRLTVLPFSHSGPVGSEWVSDAVSTLLEAALDGAGPLVLAPSGSDPADADLAVSGRAVVVGDEVEVQATLRRRDRGDVREAARGPVEELMGVVDALARSLLRGAGIADAPFAESAAVTTSSLPALKAFLRGEARFGRWRVPEAAEAYREALEHDPGFTLAFYRLGVLGHWLHDMEHTARAFAEVARGLDRLPRRDRDRFEAMLAFSTGRVEEAEHLHEAFLRSYPSDVWALTNHGYVLVRYNPFRGRSWQEARPIFRRATDVAPGATLPLLFLSTLTAAAGEMEESRRLHARLHETWDQQGWPEYPVALRTQHAFLFGDSRERAEVLDALDRASALAVYIAATVVAVTTRDPERAAEVAEILTRDHRAPEVRATGWRIVASAAAARGRWRAARRHLDVSGDLDAPTAREHGALLALSPFAPAASGEELLAAVRDAPPDPGEGRRRGHGPEWSQYFDPHRSVRPRVRRFLAAFGCGVRGEPEEGLRHARALRESGDDGHAPPPFVRSLAGWLEVELTEMDATDPEALRSLRPVIEGLTPTAAIASAFFSQPLRRLRYAAALEESGRPWGALRWLRGLGEVTLHDLPFMAPALLAEARLLGRLGEVEAAATALRRFRDVWRDCDEDARQPLEEAEGLERELERAR